MNLSRLVLLIALGLLGGGGCRTKLPLPPPPTPVPAAVEPVPPIPPPEPKAITNVFFSEKLVAMDAAIEQAITAGQCPGGVLWVEREGVAYTKAFGRRALVPAPEPMTEDTIFDLASLTKVVATTPAVMVLIERGQVDLDAPAARYLPPFAGDGKETVTVRQLLTHTSGLRPDIGLAGWQGEAGAIEMACAERLRSPPGTAFVYSDINFFLLGEIVQRVSGRKFDEFLTAEIYGPLKMDDTGFRPPASARAALRRRKCEPAFRCVVWCMIPLRAKWVEWLDTPGCFRPRLTWPATQGCW